MIRILLIAIIAFGWICDSTRGSVETDVLQRVWTDRSNGIMDLNIVSIDLDSSGQRVLCASDQTVYLSENAGLTWKTVFRSFPVSEAEDFLETMTVEQDEDESEEAVAVPDFDRSDYDVDDLYDWGILDPEEELDDLTDDELRDRLEDAKIIDISESEDFAETEAGLPDEVSEPTDAMSITIHQVCWDPSDSRYAYLATNRGLYVSIDHGQNWRVTRSKAAQESVLRVVVIPPRGLVVVAMTAGLMLSEDRGLTFIDTYNFPDNRAFSDLEYDRYRSDKIAAVLDGYVALIPVGDETDPEPARTILKDADIHSIAFDSAGNIYAAGDSAVYKLSEAGSWLSATADELLGAEIRDIDCTLNNVIAGTSRGVFFWNTDDWKGRFYNVGLTEYGVRDVTVNPMDPSEVWIATGSGVFTLLPQRLADLTVARDVELPEDFPSVDQMIKAMLIHSEINTARDAQWLDWVKSRAWIPQIDFYLFVRSRDRYQYMMSPVISVSAGQSYTGPDNERYDHWDRDRVRVRLSMVWKPQLAVFHRDSLTAQKRLTSEIKRRGEAIRDLQKLYTALVRLYSERTGGSSIGAQVDTHLRIQLIQAQLDALTGFTFTNLNRDENDT